MEQLKFALGPYELFAAVIGGLPLALAGFLLYYPVPSLQALMPILQNNATPAIALTLLLASYVLGSLVSGVTWDYFLLLCRLLGQQYTYFGNLIAERSALLAQTSPETEPVSFEDRLVRLLDQKVGIPTSVSWLDARVMAYLRHHKAPCLVMAESHMASHVMYRNLSCGFLTIAAVLIVNSIRLQSLTLEQGLLPLASISMAYIAFLRAVTFKRWHNREILLGFYFTASEDGS